jgi:UDP-N-acetylglucosamine:LPS N-acetylglucosamine transferase
MVYIFTMGYNPKVGNKILIFVSKTGGGHISLAEGLRDLADPQDKVEIIDPQPSLVVFHYRMVSRYALWLWQWEYTSSDNPPNTLQAHRLFSTIIGRSVERVIREVNPDLILSTYPFLTWEVSDALQQLRLRTPFAYLLADPQKVHSSWLNDRRAACVFCPTSETYTQALSTGFEERQLHLSGWPVRGQFFQAARMPTIGAETLQSLGLQPDLFTIFLQGGGEGSARFVHGLQDLLAIDEVQVILAAGSNKFLQLRFKGSERLHVLPFTRQIAPYMAAANVIMGKAGPNMLFESVVLGKPFIATSYIPGQEQPNLEFIQNHSLGWVALEQDSQAALVRELVQKPSRLDKMKSSVDSYNEWNSSRLETIPSRLKELQRS